MGRCAICIFMYCYNQHQAVVQIYIPCTSNWQQSLSINPTILCNTLSSSLLDVSCSSIVSMFPRYQLSNYAHYFWYDSFLQWGKKTIGLAHGIIKIDIISSAWWFNAVPNENSQCILEQQSMWGIAQSSSKSYFIDSISRWSWKSVYIKINPIQVCPA